MVAWPLQLLAAAALLCASSWSSSSSALLHSGDDAAVPSSSTATSPTSTASPDAASPKHSARVVVLSSVPLTRHSRLATRDIQRFRSYKDVSMLPFHVPQRIRYASFNFTVTESVMSALVRKCPPRNVTIVLKYGSYPVINPDGARYPDHYDIRRLPYFEHEFQSDGKPRTLNVTNPLPGEWYAVAFLSYTDPNDDKILQQGLSASCLALLEGAMDISAPEEVPQLAAGVATVERVEGSDAEALRKDYRVHVPENARVVRVELLVTSCSRSRCPTMMIAARSHTFPGCNESDGGNDTVRTTCSGSDIQRGEDCELVLTPEEDAWLFVSVEVTPDPKSLGKDTQVSYALNVTFDFEQSSGEDTECNTVDAECWNRVPLTRQSYVSLFMYNYVRVIDPAKPSTASQAQAVNISTVAPTLFTFPVFPVKDIGGTLTLELRLDKTSALVNATTSKSEPNTVSSTSSSISTTTDSTPFAVSSVQSVNVSVIACLSFSSKRVPSFPDTCEDAGTGSTSSASVRVNTTSATSYTGKLHVPFPEPGRWYLSLRPFCFTSSGNDSHLLVDCGDLNETQLSFVLDSEMCGADSCGQWGHCNNYLSGGVIFATCVCEHGYRGWGCTDDQRIDQLRDLLIAALLLTLSNLPFLPAAVLAARRGYYTEAFVYCCTLFFSTFYHACEAGEDVYSYCLMKLHVLQFCDFYSAILALWVTMVAMADLPPTPRSLLHMAGAVGIALGTEYDRTSLSVFMVPTLVGVALVGTRWGMRCRAQRSCYPHKNYWKFCVPPGAILVVVGIVCFSFLQTRSNYKYVHSAWHSMMAFAIMFVLPSRRHSAFESVESDDSVDSATPFWKRMKRWFCKMTTCRCCF